jgi:hypothetical protein
MRERRSALFLERAESLRSRTDVRMRGREDWGSLRAYGGAGGVWSVGVQAVEETVEGGSRLGAGLFWVSRVGDVEGGFVHYR